MTDNEQQVVEYVVARISKSFPVQHIILFGSRARGEATEDSDYDFLIVMNFALRRAQAAVEVRKAAHVPSVPMDFLIRSPREWEAGFLLKKEIIAEGKVVYEAADTGVDDQGTCGSAFGQSTV
ncbi:MAG: nucleotidyltransferase domain-containing protein [Coriobacteriia bacterium]